MGEEIGIKSYVIQLFNKTKTTENLVIALKHFMFDDQRNPMYIHLYENTIFIYTIHDFWNMNSLSMVIRSHLLGDYFIIYEIDSYDGLLPATVWEKKADAIKYFKNKESVLSKYKRKYLIDKVTHRTFLLDNGEGPKELKPTAEDTFVENLEKAIIEQEKKPTAKKKLSEKKTILPG